MSNYSVKAFLEFDDKPAEVRRFALTKADAKSFSVLCDKLQTVFGTKLTKDEYAIYWKDEEGDRIRASSDDELAYAIKSMKDDVCKIYIQPLKTNFAGASEKTYHPGVVCDICDEEIYGFRYKCMQCPDFDLCSSCEHQGNHGEHNMIRISSPVKPGQRGHYSWKFRPRHGFRHGFSGRHQSCPGNAGDAPGCKGRRNRSPRFGEPFHPYNLLSKMWSAMGGMHFDPEEANPNSTQTQANPEESEGANNNNTDQSQEEEYLRNIGETVAAVLDPFGIDVIVGVEHNGVRTDINSKSDETMQTDQSTDNQHLDAETGVSAQKDRADGGVEKDANAEPSLASNGDGNGWTYLDVDIDKATEEMQNIPEMMSKVQINETEPVHPDPAIAEAAATMMSMGFGNENGWLTSLLELNEGSIDRVFEILAELGQGDGPTKNFIEIFLALLKRNGGDTAKVVAIMQAMKKRK